MMPSPDVPVRLVAASTLTERMFWRATYLGRSLALIPEALRPALTLHPANTGKGARGLPALYNEALDAAGDDEILVLLHDDVYLHDWAIAARAREAVGCFDVAGIAGSVDPDLSQPAWGLAFDADLRRTGWQPGVTRSGAVNHFDYVHPAVEVFGPAPARCRLVDGVLMVLHAGRVRAAGARFDERFDFHFYDLDFCRTAERAGLAIGTWPIAVTHDSTGGYGSKAFREAAAVYLDKWATPRRV